MQGSSLRDFQIIKTIGIIYTGTGTFARVAVARPKNGNKGTFYAIKMINKEILAKLKQVEHSKCEKQVLMRLDCPFILKV